MRAPVIFGDLQLPSAAETESPAMTDPLPRKAGLDSKLSAACEDMPEERVAASHRIAVKDGPDLAFDGYLLSAYTTNEDRPRWSELQLWQTDEGNFVGARAWHSRNAGEGTFWTADVVDTVEDAMQLWGWDSVAKGFARQLRWDVVKYVD